MGFGVFAPYSGYPRVCEVAKTAGLCAGGGPVGGGRAWGVVGARCAPAAAGVAAFVLSAGRTGAAATDSAGAVHEGVASCAGSSCHSRQVDSGVNVRQNELITWQ